MNHDTLSAFGDEDRQLLDTAEAARLLHVSPKTLAYWRSTGDGPVFLRLGIRTVRYRRGDLLTYLDSRRTVNNVARPSR